MHIPYLKLDTYSQLQHVRITQHAHIIRCTCYLPEMKKDILYKINLIYYFWRQNSSNLCLSCWYRPIWELLAHLSSLLCFGGVLQDKRSSTPKSCTSRLGLLMKALGRTTGILPLKFYFFGIMLPEIVYPKHPNLPLDYSKFPLYNH